MRITKDTRVDPAKNSLAFLQLVEQNKKRLREHSRRVTVSEEQLHRCRFHFGRLIKELGVFDEGFYNALLVVNDLSSGMDFDGNHNKIYFPDEEELSKLLSRHKATYPKWL